MRLFPFLLLSLALLTCVGCWRLGDHQQAAAPDGEVWLTSVQVRAALIITAPAALEDVDEIILSSGRVSVDDARKTTVDDLDHVLLHADVHETDLSRVRLGALVKLQTAAFPKRSFNGKVDWIADAPEPDTHTARIRCAFDNRDRALRPEMYATVYLSAAPRKALALPQSAILRTGEKRLVFVARGQAPDGRTRFARTPVQIEVLEGSKRVVVQRGLEEGTEVVISGALFLLGMM